LILLYIYTNFTSSTPVWKHVVSTLNKSTNTLLTYINGVLVKTLTVSYVNNNNTTSSFMIGNLCINGSKIDDFRFYNRILTDSEISYIYNGNVDISLPNPSGYDGYNINIKDESGNAGIYRIRLTPLSGLIDGNNYVDMNINYMSLHVVARNNNWWII